MATATADGLAEGTVLAPEAGVWCGAKTKMIEFEGVSELSVILLVIAAGLVMDKTAKPVLAEVLVGPGKKDELVPGLIELLGRGQGLAGPGDQVEKTQDFGEHLGSKIGG